MDHPELREIWVRGYRSVFDLRLELGRVNVVVGKNGTGKTNLYRALQLMSAAAGGTLLEEMAREGGMLSATWAGPRRSKKDPVRIVLGAAFADLSIEIQLGLPIPVPGGSAFDFDPEVKEEIIWPTAATKRSWLFKRTPGLVQARTDDGGVAEYPGYLRPWEVGLAELSEPTTFPEIAVLRDRIAGWRFYHQFRTDDQSPLREPRVGWRSPVLASDGANLAATLQTIREIGDDERLDEVIASVFGGGAFTAHTHGNVFDLEVSVPELYRPLTLRELSDGQLRFLCLAAALSSPRPPAFIVLNEPESSLYDELLPQLADLVDSASRRSQIWLTTHSAELARLLEERGQTEQFELERVEGKTQIVGQPRLTF